MKVQRKCLSLSVTPEVYDLLCQEARKVQWGRSQLLACIVSQWVAQLPDNGGVFSFLPALSQVGGEQDG